MADARVIEAVRADLRDAQRFLQLASERMRNGGMDHWPRETEVMAGQLAGWTDEGGILDQFARAET